jgi:hypothetical protein
MPLMHLPHLPTHSNSTLVNIIPIALEKTPLWVSSLKWFRQLETIMRPRSTDHFRAWIVAVDCSLDNDFWTLRHREVRK